MYVLIICQANVNLHNMWTLLKLFFVMFVCDWLCVSKYVLCELFFVFLRLCVRVCVFVSECVCVCVCLARLMGLEPALFVFVQELGSLWIRWDRSLSPFNHLAIAFRRRCQGFSTSQSRDSNWWLLMFLIRTSLELSSLVKKEKITNLSLLKTRASDGPRDV